MIEFSNNTKMVESVNELPFTDVEHIELLFADMETGSGDDQLDALNPWHHCYAAGIAITIDNYPSAFYIPIAHRFGVNLPFEAVADWWYNILVKTKRWINHNCKFDCHVSTNSLGVLPTCEIYDTLTHAKIIDSDRQFKGGYSLDALSLAWISEDIRPYEAKLKAKLGKSKDYSSIRSSDMAEYAGQDCLTTRRLYRYIEQMLPPECAAVSQMELELTPILFEMEREGLCVDVDELMLEELEVTSRMLEIDVALAKRLGRTINPSSRDDVYDVLINQFGLPGVEWTDEDDDGAPAGNISFNKAAMAKYLVHPDAPHDVVSWIAEYRGLSTFRSLFLQTYQDLNVDGRLHGYFNQILRTGRMSMSKPNAQQLNKRAKKLIHPPSGEAFLSYDQSQIEFRVIVHYIQDQRCIAAYEENPDTDFHEWVASLAGIKRKPAKTLNFQNGYGGGKAKCVKSLSINTDIVGGVVGHVDQLIAEGKITEAERKQYQELFCTQLAEKVYNDYHSALPTLKPTSRRAGRICADRGHVFTAHGRRRHLQSDFAHNAFNSVCQGTAADIQKERTIAAYRFIKQKYPSIRMAANVHDETLFVGPKEIMRQRKVQVELSQLLENTAIPLRVPLRVSCGYSENNWYEASTDVKDGGNSAPLIYTEEEKSWSKRLNEKSAIPQLSET